MSGSTFGTAWPNAISLCASSADAQRASRVRIAASTQPSSTGPASSDRSARSTRAAGSAASHSSQRAGATRPRRCRSHHARSPVPCGGFFGIPSRARDSLHAAGGVGLDAGPEAAADLQRRAGGLVGEPGEIGVRQPGQQVDRGRADLDSAVGPAALEQRRVVRRQARRQRRRREGALLGRGGVPVRGEELAANRRIRCAQRGDDSGTSRGRRCSIPCGRRVADRPGHPAGELRQLSDEPRGTRSEDRRQRGTRVGVPAQRARGVAAARRSVAACRPRPPVPATR